MKRSWTTLAHASGGLHAVADFERAAYRLVSEQVLYASDRGSRAAYHLVEAHLEDFAAALAPLGIRLERHAQHRYVVALPQHAEGSLVTIEETLALLVLRQRYDEAVRQGRVEESGDVVVELTELQEAWPALTGRPMPDVGQLRALLRALRRWGVARLVESPPEEAQPFHLEVRPAIVDVVGEQWLQRLDQFNGDDDAPDVGLDEPRGDQEASDAAP
jgi:hypothetical protein